MISFIIIGRNESWRLEKCLASIRQTATRELNIPYELIYVDSQSGDDSISLSKQYADKTFLITGVYNAAIGRNIGAKEAKGEILLFMDGDMELRKGVLSSLLTDKGQLVYPFISGVEYEYLYDKDWTLKGERIRRKFVEGEDVYEPTSGGLFAIEKRLWDEVGGMDNRFFRSQDMDFGFRMSEKGIPLLSHRELILLVLLQLCGRNDILFVPREKPRYSDIIAHGCGKCNAQLRRNSGHLREGSRDG